MDFFERICKFGDMQNGGIAGNINIFYYMNTSVSEMVILLGN